MQAGAFGSSDNAQRLAQNLRLIAPTNVHLDNSMHRVLLGPFPNTDHAKSVVTQLADAGQPSAFVVAE